MTTALAPAPPVGDSDAVEALLAPARIVSIWPGHDYALSQAEAALIATPPFQRLSRLRQMGLAYLASPNAENTRASHSIGVACWASRFHESLRPQLPESDLSPALVTKLFALLHDIDLLPLGHTLRYQSNLLPEAAGHPRMAACVEAIVAHVAGHGLLAIEQREEALACFERHLRAAATARPAHTEPACALAAELVNSMLGADLFDFALRDSLAIGREQALHRGYPAMLRLVRQGRRLRTAISAEHASIAADLYRARFELFAHGVNDPRKLAADAMLDLIARRIDAGSADTRWSDTHLLHLGDDEFLALAAELEARLGDGIGLTDPLRWGLLHQEVFRLDSLETLRRRPDAERALSLEAEWRSEAEAALIERLPHLAPGEVIVAVSPAKMQVKPPDILLVEPDGTLRPIAEMPGLDVLETAAAYAKQWSLRVYLAPQKLAEAAPLRRIAAELFAPDALPW